MREAKLRGRHVIIEGFRDVKVENLNTFFNRIKREAEGCQVQFFDAELIAGFDHLYFAALNALKAHDTGTNISKSLAVETLLYTSGQHQISKAIELLGIKPSSSQVVVLVIADTAEKAVGALDMISNLLGGEVSDEVTDLTDAKVETIKRAFELGYLEIEATRRESEKEAVTSLLIERAALLATES